MKKLLKYLPYFLSITLLVIAALTFLISKSEKVDAFVFSNGYQFGRSLTVINASSTQSSFPVEVSTNGASSNDLNIGNLKYVSFGGVVQSTTGLDIIFTSDSAGNTILPFERETYSSSTGASVFWVNVPSVTNSTVFYMFYGKAGDTDHSAASSVWDANFKFVAHLQDGTTLNVADSTASPATGTNHSAQPTAGKIDGGASTVSGSSQYMDWGSPTKTQITNNVTMSTWVNIPVSATTLSGIPFMNQFRQATFKGITFTYNAGAAHNVQISAGNGSVVDGIIFSQQVDDAAPHYLVATFASGTYTLFIDSVKLTPQVGVITSIVYGTTDLILTGRNQAGGGFFTGVWDENRISDTVRSDSWITTEYNNQSNVSTFLTMSSEVTGRANWKQTGGKVSVGNVSGACGSSYKFCSTVTINNASSTQTNFPMEFSFNDGTASSTTLTTLKYNSSGGAIQSMSGYDIVFSTSSTASGLLPCDREIYIPTTGRTIIWVQIPSVVNAGTLYMFWGKPADTDHCTASAVWDTNYKAIYHLPNGTTLTANDSTGTNNGAVTGATATTGQVDGAASFNGTNSTFISVPNNASLNPGTANMTLSAWAKPPNTAQISTMLIKSGGGSSYNQYWMAIGTNDYGATNGKKFIVQFRENASTLQHYTSTNDIADGNWHYFSVSYTAGSNPILYVDGVSVAGGCGASCSGTPNLTDTTALQIGRYLDGDSVNAYYFNGPIDEVRVSSGVARSSSWILTEYNNQYSPSTFYSLSTPTPGGAGGKVIIK